MTGFPTFLIHGLLNEKVVIYDKKVCSWCVLKLQAIKKELDFSNSLITLQNTWWAVRGSNPRQTD